MKESFVFYKQWRDALQRVPREQRLQLYEIVIDYAILGEVPEIKDVMIAVTFDFIKERIDADIKRYESKVEAGRKGGLSRSQAETSNTQATPKQHPSNIQAERKQNQADTNLNVSVSVSESDIKEKNIIKKESKRFVKPSLEEVAEYCRKRGNGVDAQAFLDHYEAKGWMIGKNPMKDWQAAVRTWERNNQSSIHQVEKAAEDEERDPNLPDPKEWEGFKKYVNNLGGLDITPHQYTELKTIMRNFQASQEVFKGVIDECCKRGSHYLDDNLDWKVVELIRTVEEQINREGHE